MKTNRKKWIFWLLAFRLTFGISVVSGATDTNRISILPVPTLGFSPETRGYAGAVCQMAFKTNVNTRISSLKLEFQYTQRKQAISELSGTVFMPSEKWIINFTAHHSRFPDYWWGIGINTPENNKEAFNSWRTWLEVAILKRIRQNWFTGPLVRYQKRNEIIFDRSSSAKNLSVSAAGLQCLHDSRDNLLNPQKGAYLDLQMARNYANNIGNGYRMLVDCRKYFKTGKQSVTAGRLLFSHLTAQTHFFDLSLLGGDRNLRGYYLGRFRDRGMLVFNSEIRTRIYKRWGAALGMGAGTVFSKPTDIFSHSFKPALNAGMRFTAARKENINLRIDYAIGVKGQSGFYFAFGEAF